MRCVRSDRGVKSMVAAVGLVVMMIAMPGATAGEPGASQRRLQELGDGWRFMLGDPQGAEATDFDDTGWKPVVVPHTWNTHDGQDGGNDYHRGPGWYRRELAIPADAKRRHFLRFGAASLTADVYLDGRLIGRHLGGFAAFCIEITPRVNPGGRHRLAVRVDNTRNPDVVPLSGDFTVCGGLYRPVHLLTTGMVCVDPLDHASAGVYVDVLGMGLVSAPEKGGETTEGSEINADSADPATVRIRTLLSYGGAAGAPENAVANITGEDAGATLPVRVVTIVRDGDGREVVRAEAPAVVRGGARVEVTQAVRIERPRPWNGRKDPHRYTARVEVRGESPGAAGGEAELLDAVEQSFGVRSFALCPERGFFLNGEYLDLRGVSRHQDRPDRGWAIGRADIEEDFAIIEEMGATAVRLAHYPHDPYAHELADRLGLVLWVEIPLIDVVTDSNAFRENVRMQLVEMIRQNYNHPSICFWGIHNEVTAPWRPGPDPTSVVRDLTVLAKREDAGRLTASAGCDPEEHAANWVTEAIAFNRYFGWYVDEPDDFAAWADRMRAARPGVALGVSEYGAGASAFQNEPWPPVKPVHNGPWHPEEWQMHLHERHWLAMKERPYLWCKFVWNGFDFASDGRREGDRAGINDKGLVTHDRRIRKDAWFWLQANWSDAPMIHLAGRRSEAWRAGEGNTLTVYSNCDALRVWVNGEPLGAGHEAPERVLRLFDVRLVEGENVIRAAGRHAGGVVEDEIRVVARGGK